jgi:hypothetical protein
MSFAGLLKFVYDHRHEFGDVALAGGRVDAENAGVRKAPVEGIDRIAEPARSRTSWKSLDDMPPPRIIDSTCEA